MDTFYAVSAIVCVIVIPQVAVCQYDSAPSRLSPSASSSPHTGDSNRGSKYNTKISNDIDTSYPSAPKSYSSVNYTRIAQSISNHTRASKSRSKYPDNRQPSYFQPRSFQEYLKLMQALYSIDPSAYANLSSDEKFSQYTQQANTYPSSYSQTSPPSAQSEKSIYKQYSPSQSSYIDSSSYERTLTSSDYTTSPSNKHSPPSTSNTDSSYKQLSPPTSNTDSSYQQLSPPTSNTDSPNKQLSPPTSYIDSPHKKPQQSSSYMDSSAYWNEYMSSDNKLSPSTPADSPTDIQLPSPPTSYTDSSYIQSPPVNPYSDSSVYWQEVLSSYDTDSFPDKESSPSVFYSDSSPHKQDSPSTSYGESSSYEQSRSSTYTQTSPTSTYTQTSPTSTYPQTSSTSTYTQTSPASTYTQTSPTSIYTQTSPTSTYTQTSPTSTYTQTSTTSTYTQTSQSLTSHTTSYSNTQTTTPPAYSVSEHTTSYSSEPSHTYANNPSVDYSVSNPKPLPFQSVYPVASESPYTHNFSSSYPKSRPPRPEYCGSAYKKGVAGPVARFPMLFYFRFPNDGLLFKVYGGVNTLGKFVTIFSEDQLTLKSLGYDESRLLVDFSSSTPIFVIKVARSGVAACFISELNCETDFSFWAATVNSFVDHGIIDLTYKDKLSYKVDSTIDQVSYKKKVNVLNFCEGAYIWYHISPGTGTNVYTKAVTVNAFGYFVIYI